MDGEMAGGAAEARTVALFMEQMPPCHGVLGCKSLLLPLLEGHPKEGVLPRAKLLTNFPNKYT